MRRHEVSLCAEFYLKGERVDRLIGLLVIAVVIVMLALAGNSIFRNAPLDGTWSLFLGGVIATVFGVPEVAARLKEKRAAPPPPNPPVPPAPPSAGGGE